MLIFVKFLKRSTSSNLKLLKLHWLTLELLVTPTTVVLKQLNFSETWYGRRSFKCFQYLLILITLMLCYIQEEKPKITFQFNANLQEEDLLKQMKITLESIKMWMLLLIKLKKMLQLMFQEFGSSEEILAMRINITEITYDLTVILLT